jgi:hypothetical protein
MYYKSVDDTLKYNQHSIWVQKEGEVGNHFEQDEMGTTEYW